MMYVQVYIWSFQAAFNFLSDDIELVYHYLIEYERSLPANEHMIGVIVERKRRSREMHEKQREYYRAIDHLNELNKLECVLRTKLRFHDDYKPVPYTEKKK